jgi:nucleotidyltransferase substrate binding protein (TIGR01987 family)
MLLELESLRKAVTALNEALAMSDDADFMNRLPKARQDTVKAGVIHAFEFTYELCWKFMKRWLDLNVSPNATGAMTRRALFRLAGESGLIDDVERWFRHHEARNQTANTYQAAIAESVCVVAHDFARDAAALLKTLEAHND